MDYKLTFAKVTDRQEQKIYDVIRISLVNKETEFYGETTAAVIEEFDRIEVVYLNGNKTELLDLQFIAEFQKRYSLHGYYKNCEINY